jgi:hypothetical protein
MAKFTTDTPVILTQEQLEERLRYWQHRLRLMDWVIFAEVCRMRDIDGIDARTIYVLPLKNARIWVGDETDYNPTVPLPLDMELNLVHELLHIVMGEITDDIEREERGPKYNAMEQSIEAIAYALVHLERERQKLLDDNTELRKPVPCDNCAVLRMQLTAARQPKG